MRSSYSIIATLSLFLLFACDTLKDQSPEEVKIEAITKAADTLKTAAKSEKKYDADLAESYGADDYGMRTYVMAFLKSGPNRPKDSAKSAELMRAHLDNINRLAEEGKLVLAGPFYGDGDLRGIYLFDTDNLDSAKSYTATDPAIQYGSLEMELLKWYGSAALMGVPEVHEVVSKSEI